MAYQAIYEFDIFIDDGGPGSPVVPCTVAHWGIPLVHYPELGNWDRT